MLGTWNFTTKTKNADICQVEEKDIEVVMTRSKDNYVSLKDRCKIANKSKADLFVSIHRNSAELGNGVELWINSN